jgi:hypothetical protein
MSGDSHEITWFTETDRAGAIDYIKAVVVRRPSRPAATRTPFLASTLGMIFSVMWLKLLRALSPERAAHAALDRAKVQLASGWSGSSGPEGPGQILYSRERSVVSVSGRELSLPAGTQALLVLVDARAPVGQPTLETHEVSAPTVPRLPLDPSAGKEANRQRIRAQHRAARDVWHRWLDEEPTIRAFLGHPT